MAAPLLPGFRLSNLGVAIFVLPLIAAWAIEAALTAAVQFPQVSAALSFSPGTVARAHRFLDLHGVLETQDGVGSSVDRQGIERSESGYSRQLSQLAAGLVTRAAAAGSTAGELLDRLCGGAGRAPVKRR